MNEMKNDTHSLFIFVQFPIRSRIFPDISVPSILLQLVDEVLEFLTFRNENGQNI